MSTEFLWTFQEHLADFSKNIIKAMLFSQKSCIFPTKNYEQKSRIFPIQIYVQKYLFFRHIILSAIRSITHFNNDQWKFLNEMFAYLYLFSKFSLIIINMKIFYRFSFTFNVYRILVDISGTFSRFFQKHYQSNAFFLKNLVSFQLKIMSKNLESFQFKLMCKKTFISDT